MQLIPATDRDKTTKDIDQEMDKALADIPGAEIPVRAMEEGMEMGDPIQIQLSGNEHEVLSEHSEQVVANITGVKGIYNPETDESQGVSEMTGEIDDEKAATYGITEEQNTGQIQLQFTG